MDDIQGLKNPSSGHPVITCPLARQLTPDKPHFNPVPKVEPVFQIFSSPELQYYIKHCHSSEQ